MKEIWRDKTWREVWQLQVRIESVCDAITVALVIIVESYHFLSFNPDESEFTHNFINQVYIKPICFVAGGITSDTNALWHRIF